MLPYVIGGLIGAWAIHARAPRAKHRKYTSFGARTGNVWQVEVFPELGVYTVRSGPNVATLKMQNGKSVLINFKGAEGVLEAVAKDFIQTEVK
jgi:hypothetical protein